MKTKAKLILVLAVCSARFAFAQLDTCQPDLPLVIDRFPECETCINGVLRIPGGDYSNIVWSDESNTVIDSFQTAWDLTPGWYYVSYVRNGVCFVQDSIELKTDHETFNSACKIEIEWEFIGNGLCGHGANFIDMSIKSTTGEGPFTFYDFEWKFTRTLPVSLEASSPWYEISRVVGVVDKNGCSYKEEVVLPTLYDFEFNVSLPTCDSCTDGSIEPIITRGLPKDNKLFNYHWSKLYPKEYLGSDSILENVGVGFYELRFDGDGGCGDRDTVEVKLDGQTGFNDLEWYDVATVYPNPNNGTFAITLPDVNTTTQFEVYDATGKKVSVKQISSGQTISSNLVQGLYFYNVYQKNRRIATGKFLIKN